HRQDPDEERLGDAGARAEHERGSARAPEQPGERGREHLRAEGEEDHRERERAEPRDELVFREEARRPEPREPRRDRLGREERPDLEEAAERAARHRRGEWPGQGAGRDLGGHRERLAGRLRAREQRHGERAPGNERGLRAERDGDARPGEDQRERRERAHGHFATLARLAQLVRARLFGPLVHRARRIAAPPGPPAGMPSMTPRPFALTLHIGSNARVDPAYHPKLSVARTLDPSCHPKLSVARRLDPPCHPKRPVGTKPRPCLPPKTFGGTKARPYLPPKTSGRHEAS